MASLHRILHDLQASDNPFLYLPFLLGYLRMLLALLSFWFMSSSPLTAALLYTLSMTIDMVDGLESRLARQVTRLGGMMDMLTDMGSTVGLLATLATLYPSHLFGVQVWMVVSLASHWLHLHTTLLQGLPTHRAIPVTSNPWLRLYYTHPAILPALVLATQGFLLALYLAHFQPSSTLLPTLATLCLPGVAVKAGVEVLQLGLAAQVLAGVDARRRGSKE